jgi:hypothetical protein
VTSRYRLELGFAAVKLNADLLADQLEGRKRSHKFEVDIAMNSETETFTLRSMQHDFAGKVQRQRGAIKRIGLVTDGKFVDYLQMPENLNPILRILDSDHLTNSRIIHLTNTRQRLIRRIEHFERVIAQDLSETNHNRLVLRGKQLETHRLR